MLGSSAVEQVTVNHLVAGSIPARAASKKTAAFLFLEVRLFFWGNPKGCGIVILKKYEFAFKPYVHKN